MRRDWAVQPEIGRHDTVFRYSFSSGNWQTILISFRGAIGLPELGTLSAAIECESWIYQEPCRKVEGSNKTDT